MLLQMARLQTTKSLIGVKWFNAAAAARVPAVIEAEKVHCRGLSYAYVHLAPHIYNGLKSCSIFVLQMIIHHHLS